MTNPSPVLRPPQMPVIVREHTVRTSKLRLKGYAGTIPWFEPFDLVATAGLLAYLLGVINRWWRFRRLANVVTVYTEISQGFIDYGVRGGESIKILLSQTRPRHVGGTGKIMLDMPDLTLRLVPEIFTPDEIGRICRWVGLVHEDPDVCDGCGYDLRGSPGPTCPECGVPIRTLGEEPTPPRF